MMHAIKQWWSQRGWKQKTGLLLLIIVLAFYGVHKLKQIKYHPWRNPHPQYTVTIKGHVDPAIADIVKLKWIAIYGSSIPECDITYNWFEGIIGARGKTVAFIPTVDAAGNYQIQIPIDYFKPGYCKWQIYVINDATNVYKAYENDKGETFHRFNPCGYSKGCDHYDSEPTEEQEKNYPTSAKSIFSCRYDNKKRLECKISDVFVQGNHGLKTSRDQNYTWEQDYYLQQLNTKEK